MGDSKPCWIRRPWCLGGVRMTTQNIQNDKTNEQNRKFDKSVWVKLIPEIMHFKKELIILCVFAIITAIVDVSLSYMTKLAIDHFIVGKTLVGINYYIMGYAALIVVLGASIFTFITYGGRIEVGLSYNIHKKGFNKIQELSMSYYDKNAIGWIMARMTSDVTKLGEFISWSLLDMVWGVAMMIGIFGVMVAVNFKLALITMAVSPLLVVVSIYFQRKIIEVQRVVRKMNSKITGAINEGIIGAKTTKTLVVEERLMSEFRDMTGEMKKASVRSSIFSSMFQPVVINLGAIGTVLAIYNGGNGIIAGVISYGTLVLFINFSVQFFEPVREMARILAEMQSAQVAAERIYSLLDATTEVIEKESVLEKYGSVINPNYEAFEPLRGDIDFKNVNFKYKEGETVLEDLNLSFKEGQSIALVGETGSGKSTIVNLVCRFYEPTDGEILIDGRPLRDRNQSWIHQNIGYVLQSPHLFSGTIKDNIRYGNLAASDEDIIEASKYVNAHDFITSLEKGYDSEVGEGGSFLSTGQKQLISFARAIISNPRIFVLDEATSSIDTESEALIQQALQKVLNGRTSFIIAHRLSTIRSCDRILVIEKGQVIEDGSHKELIRQKGHYYKLYTNQFIEENEEKLLA